ncbi:MAG: tRNA preQ1(34) S-adenosylmethionine ribosyltransferase-isomerase QueA [Oscillospiraceae bacterium]|jgi:S-adenosylmethionine:tRNA ribosyltransferase-isomerase|nr:tRNA preQ1(34) S-adenosylmethionine ribosyltransferase-isomerase QueA [Oscillospiraceae bacterium]
MRKSDFYYELPEELIAQKPIEPRDSSRLLVIDRQTGALRHDYFYNLAGFLNKGDLLVMNNSKVFPARLLVGDTEILLLEPRGDDVWECIGRNLKKGRVIDFGAKLTAEIIEIINDGNRLVKFSYSGDFYAILDEIGHTPLPQYITEKLDDSSRYNTIYAAEAGSAAAPTAGLHLTERVLERLAEKGVETAYVTLHVGLGTFRPVKCENIKEHKMHSERYLLSEETAQKIAACKARGNRVIAVGTTSCRTLETVGCVAPSAPKSRSGSTDIFITPGYEFKIMDGLITNFHLPESTLIMLVSAFLGREKTLAAYEEAIREEYRFFSFGDSMIIL